MIKSLQKRCLLVALIIFFAFRQSCKDVIYTLLKTETRTEMMNKSANDSSMSKEMMAAMMNSKNGKMIMMPMMENYEAMMKIMKGEKKDMKSGDIDNKMKHLLLKI